MKTPTILATVLNVAATCRHLRRGMSHNKWILSAAAAIAFAFAVPAAAAAPAHAQVCTLGTCAGFVTVHDSDGNGPAPAKTRHHENLVANLTYYLDTDGDLPAAQATVLGDYELRVKIEGLSADKPKVTIAKLKADEALPLKIEVVKANSNGTFKGLGYDARTSWTGKVSSAPRLFVADIDTSNRDGDATTDQSRVTATIEGAPADLMLVNESFRGQPAGTRTDRHLRKAMLISDTSGATVPRQITLDLLEGDKRMNLKVTRDVKTKVEYELIAPDRPRISGRVFPLPNNLDLTISDDVPVNDDADPEVDYFIDKQLDYKADEGAFVSFRSTRSDGYTNAQIENLPREAHLSYRADEDASGNPFHKITYDAVGRPRFIQVGQEKTETVDGVARTVTINGRVSGGAPNNFPTKIRDLTFTAKPEGPAIHYEADSTTDWVEFERTVEAGKAIERKRAKVWRPPARVDLALTAAPGEHHASYLADTGAERAEAEIFRGHKVGGVVAIDSRLQAVLAGTRQQPLPKAIGVDLVRSGDDTSFDYTADGPIAQAELHGDGLSGLPRGIEDVDVVLTGVPTRVEIDSLKRAATTVRRWLDCGSSTVNCPPEPQSEEERREWEENGWDECDWQDMDAHPCPRDERDTTTTTATSTFELEFSAPNEPLGSADIQLNSGSPVELPVIGRDGLRQDGLVLRDLPDSFAMHGRISQLVSGKLKMRDLKVTEENPIRPRTSESVLGVELTTRPEEPRALAVDVRTAGSHTDAFLARLPSYINATQKNRNARVGFTDLTYEASDPVDGYTAPGGFLRPGLSLAQTGSDGSSQQLTLKPVPRQVRICKSDSTAYCADHAFDENINRLAGGDHDRSTCAPMPCPPHTWHMPIAPDVANTGSIMLTAATATDLSYQQDRTSVNLKGLTRFVLQAHSEEWTDALECSLPNAPCQIAYLGIDTGGAPLEGQISKESDGSETFFDFPAGWSSDKRVWALHRDASTHAWLAVTGPDPVCPQGTVMMSGDNDLRDRFCKGEAN